MNYASTKMKTTISDCMSQMEPNIIPKMRNKNKQKYKETLELIEEWSDDLMHRES